MRRQSSSILRYTGEQRWMRKDKKEKEEEEENTTASHTENMIIQGCSSRRQPLFAYYDFGDIYHHATGMQRANKMITY